MIEIWLQFIFAKIFFETTVHLLSKFQINVKQFRISDSASWFSSIIQDDAGKVIDNVEATDKKEGKWILHTGFDLAYNTSVPQEGVFTEIRQRSQAVATMAVWGKEAIWHSDSELQRHIESHIMLSLT